MKKLFAAVLFAFLSVSAFAWDGIVTMTVTGIDIQPLGVLITMPSNCTGGAGNFVIIPKTDPLYTSYYSAILAAKTMGTTVTIYSTNISTACTIGYLHLN